VTLVATPHLDGKHAVFGKVVQGMEIVQAIRERDPGEAKPGDKLVSVTISEA
jgi:cyclophilin family peptidyl-prolyl cis-trans isomerase